MKEVKKRIVNGLWLALWIALSLFIPGLFCPVSGPGGDIVWPYAIGFVLIFLGVVLNAKKIERTVVAIVYGVIGGYLLAVPTVLDRVDAPMTGEQTVIGVLLRMTVVAMCVGLLSAALFRMASHRMDQRNSEPPAGGD